LSELRRKCFITNFKCDRFLRSVEIVIETELLFWLPFIGPIIAGFVGGKKARSLGNAIMAVLLFTFATTLTGALLIGFIAGSGGFVLVVSNVGPLLLGAIIGAILE